MKRLLLLIPILAVALMAVPADQAEATSEFSKVWKAEYLGEDADADFKSVARKANCYVCHVKKEKKDVRNEYGKAVHKFLDKEKYDKEYVKANPEKANQEILEGIKKANELKSTDGRTFKEKLEANELPATDANLDG